MASNAATAYAFSSLDQLLREGLIRTRVNATTENTTSICSICCESDPTSENKYPDMQDHTEPFVAITMCGHVFHLHCITRWLKLGNTCPLCRTALLPDYKQADRALFAQMESDSVVISFTELSDLVMRNHVPQAEELLRRVIVQTFVRGFCQVSGPDECRNVYIDGNTEDPDGASDTSDILSNATEDTEDQYRNSDGEEDLPDDFVI